MSSAARGAAWKPPRRVDVPLRQRAVALRALVVSSDGHYGGLLWDDGWVEQIDLESGAVVVEGCHEGAVAIALSPSALVTVDPRDAGWWTRRGAAPDRRVAHGLSEVSGASAVDLGAHILVWGGGSWCSWRTLTQRSVGAGSFRGELASALGHAWGSDGSTLFRMTGGGPVATGPARGGAAAARCWQQDGTGAWRAEGRVHPGPGLGSAFTPGVDVLWSVAGGVLTRWSVRGAHTVLEGVRRAAGHPSDRYVLVERTDGAVVLVDGAVHDA